MGPHSLLLIVGQPGKERLESLNAEHSSRAHRLGIHPTRELVITGPRNLPLCLLEGEERQKGIYHLQPIPGRKNVTVLISVTMQRLYFANVHSLMVLLFSVLFTGNKVGIEFSSVRRTYPVQFQIDLHIE